MSARTDTRTFSIKEASALTGLPASTLRYYESIGVVRPPSRSASSGHRVYDENDLDVLMWVACLSATGMSVDAMRQYVANSALGPDAAELQVDLLVAQGERLEREAELLAVRRKYVDLKVAYWRAVVAGDEEGAASWSASAAELADELRRAK